MAASITLPRETLSDLSTQRFQENVARSINDLQVSTSAAIAKVSSSIPAATVTPTPQAFTKSSVVNIAILAGTSSASAPHGLGVVPIGVWEIVNTTASGGINFPQLNNSITANTFSFTSTNVNFSYSSSENTTLTLMVVG